MPNMTQIVLGVLAVIFISFFAAGLFIPSETVVDVTEISLEESIFDNIENRTTEETEEVSSVKNQEDRNTISDNEEKVDLVKSETDKVFEDTVETTSDIQELIESVVADITPLPVPPVPYPEFTNTQNVNEKVRAAIVNIICTTARSGVLLPVSGSGVFIDERGIIIANAHIAQYFLLKDYLSENFVECVIRQNSPATALYRARLLYIPPEWIDENRDNIRVQEPRGTGENDFALLHVTEATDSNRNLPLKFPFIPLDVREETIDVGVQTIVAGYPAGFLGGITIIKDLYLSSTVATIKEIFTFNEETRDDLDLIALGGSILAQKGSSGGAVASVTGALEGIIVTATTEESTEERDLRAITTSHVDRSIKKFTGLSIEDFLNQDLTTIADSFENDIAPTLKNILISELEK